MNPIRNKKSEISTGSQASRTSNGTRIFVKAKPGAREDKVIPPPLMLFDPPTPSSSVAKEEYYTVSVKERPVKGRANEAITKLLAEHFKIPRSQVRLISGATSKRKVFEINN